MHCRKARAVWRSWLYLVRAMGQAQFQSHFFNLKPELYSCSNILLRVMADCATHRAENSYEMFECCRLVISLELKIPEVFLPVSSNYISCIHLFCFHIKPHAFCLGFLMALPTRKAVKIQFCILKHALKWLGYILKQRQRGQERWAVMFLMTSARYYFLKVSVPLMMLSFLFLPT